MKKAVEKQSTNLEALIEDALDFDQIYIEVSDKESEFYSILINQKMLIHLLTCNPSEY